jgi:Uma2 family endonuclease
MATGMAQGAAKLTYEDLALFPDDGKRHEIIGGEHFVTPSPNRRHQAVLKNLVWALETYLRRQRLGTLYFAPLDVVLSHHDVVEPDLLYVSAARSAILTEPNVQGAPDLVVEILSPSTRSRDERLKRDLYDRAGVAEYWIVDPEAETVKAFRRGERGLFGRPLLLTLRDGDTLSTPLLPGLEVSLAAVFEE